MLRSINNLSHGRPFTCIRHLHKSISDLHNQEEKSTGTLRQLKEEISADKERLKWRTPVNERPGEWSSKFKLFGNDEQTSDFITMMQQPISFKPKALREYWNHRQEYIERQMQQYVPERLQILGPDLAAAHFIMYRGGSVKFAHNSTWMTADKNREINLPNTYHSGYKVEALRCDNMVLYYEGLENLRCLQHLKFLSFHNVPTFDDFCLDRVSGSQYPKLEVLDISGTKCKTNGLSCLYRIPSLKLLIVDDPKQSLEYELTCSMLEEVIPNLKITGADTVHNLE